MVERITKGLRKKGLFSKLFSKNDKEDLQDRINGVAFANINYLKYSLIKAINVYRPEKNN